MIVVTVHLRSAVSSGRNRKLAIVTIANDGTGDAKTGHYNVAAKIGDRGKMRTGRVEGFPRKTKTVLELLRRALNEIKT